ncbi:hypothetical protein LXL04_020018 [Taraxacum kok-saghyz]
MVENHNDEGGGRRSRAERPKRDYCCLWTRRTDDQRSSDRRSSDIIPSFPVVSDRRSSDIIPSFAAPAPCSSSLLRSTVSYEISKSKSKIGGNTAIKWVIEVYGAQGTIYADEKYWDVIPSGDQQYEVKFSHEVYAVHLEHHTCGCRSWQLTGIPCVHAVAAILFLNGNPEDYVAVWYTTSMFGSCYRYPIKPINGPDMWPTVDCNPILPPRRRRMPGRPKVNRRKCPTEKVGKHSVSKKWTSIPRCGICHQEGHNKRRCPLLNQANAHVDEEPVAVGNEEPEAVADDANDHVYEEQVYDEHMVITNGSGGFVANKRRLPSQRITKLKLKKRVATKDGSGENWKLRWSNKALSLKNPMSCLTETSHAVDRGIALRKGLKEDLSKMFDYTCVRTAKITLTSRQTALFIGLTIRAM